MRPYLVVAECQRRGALHFHAAVRGRQDVALLRLVWGEVLERHAQGKPRLKLKTLPRGAAARGNVDVQGAGKRAGLEKVARYLAKYLAKPRGVSPAYDPVTGEIRPDARGGELPPGMRRFRRSEGIVIPEEIGEVVVGSDDEVVGAVRAALEDRDVRPGLLLCEPDVPPGRLVSWAWCASWAGRRVVVAVERVGDMVVTRLMVNRPGNLGELPG